MIYRYLGVQCTMSSLLWVQFLLILHVGAVYNTELCKLNNATPEKVKALERLRPLFQNSFHSSGNGKGTEYFFKLCGQALNNVPVDVGAVSIRTVNKKQVSTNLGKYTQSTILEGDNWISLTYHNGQKYTGTCDNSARTAKLMVVCNRNIGVGTMSVLKGYKDGGAGQCVHLFTVETGFICNKGRGLSSGSIFCIIFFTFFFSYLLFGFLYQRFIVGAKGYEQIPNLSFWLELGELEADGCDLAFRWKTRRNHSEYKGIDSDLRNDTSVVDDAESSDRDENLLPV